mmetsp:Transcript_76149/g.114656  ORF Transcript_76149/g.114656 Transcript_76149/m.114656 type:complete len:561 (+) Transcript_76149:126-1808(+)
MMGQCASGAQNAFAFASAVKSGRMPDVSTLTYQGVFNEHFFYAGQPAQAMLEANSFPIVGKDGTQWLAIYLKSVLDGRPRDATPIDLSVVIDISGSMGAGMAYSEESRCRSRLDCAKQAVAWLVREVLRADDRIALSLFNTEGHRIHNLTQIDQMDKDEWLQACDAIRKNGGTTLSAGMTVGREAFGTEAEDGSSSGRARRILFLTDMAEMGATELGEQIARYAAEDVFVSIVGMGVEFNAELTETVTKNKGSIYSSATSAEELREIIVSDFDVNSFPAAFDVELSIRSGDLKVDAVYGTPFDHHDRPDPTLTWSEEHHSLHTPHARAAAEALVNSGSNTSAQGSAQALSSAIRAALPPDCVAKVLGELEPPKQSVTEVNTFFPGHVTLGCIKGGLVLVRLASLPGAQAPLSRSLQLSLQYSDRAGTAHVQTDTVGFETAYQAGSFAWEGDDEADGRLARGLEKGLLLQRYVEICRAHLELAHAWNPETHDAEQTCATLSERLGEVMTALEDERVRAREKEAGREEEDKVRESMEKFVENFGKAIGRQLEGGGWGGRPGG